MAPRFSLSLLFRNYTQKFFPRKTRKAIENWDFIMVFNIAVSNEIKQYFLKLECQNHVKFDFIQYKENGKFLVLIAMDQHIAIDQAHDLKLLKIKNKRSYELNLKEIYTRIDEAQKSNSEHYADYLKFIAARYLPENKLILEQQKYSIFNKHKIRKYPRNQKDQLFTPQQQLRCKYNFLLTYREIIPYDKANQDRYRFPFIDIMKHWNFQDIVPIHKNSRYHPIILDSIKDYVGSNDQIYFEFVGFLQKWLVFPAAIGLITTFFNYFFQYSADDSPGDFVYSLLIMIWSIYFITNWQNQSKWLKTKQASGYNDELWSEHQNLLQKRGLSLRISNITGKKEYYLPLKEKLQYYFISIGTCFLISAASIFFMILSLNARGFVDPDHKLLYFESISSLAAKGGIFDAQTWWGQIPNLIHVLVTNVFDQSVYRPLAKKLTKIERHLNSKTHSNSIIMKFFIYEFIITFADFFYIAFVRFDIEGLRQQLLSLFFIDVIRRLVAQTIIPRFKNKYISFSLKESKFVPVPKQQQLRHYAILEVNKENFESFDDYLEIVTNFGYLAMISSCFPLAPFLIILAHSVQILQDKYKLIHIYRRRLPQKFVGMGMWKNIIVFICYISIVTNILLFAFSSQQIVSIFPQIFEGGKDLVLGNTDIATLFGGAATGVLSAMIDLGDNAVESLTDTILNIDTENVTAVVSNITDFTINNFHSFLQNTRCSSTSINDIIVNPTSNCVTSNSVPFMVQSFKPVPKQHEMEFVGILFLLQHIFLIGFILLRKVLSKRKSVSDIFLERRAYKRRIKKYLSKDILAENLRDEVVSKLIGTSISQQDPLDFLGKLIQKTDSETTQDQSISQSQMFRNSLSQNGDFFTSIVQTLADRASRVFGVNSLNKEKQDQKIMKKN